MVDRELQTIGYQGHDNESFLWLLRKAGTKVVIDVRRSARSRNHDFGKSALEKALVQAGITYLHMPELGTAPELRARLDQGAHFDAYRTEYLRSLKRHEASVRKLHALVVEKCCCLMCMERDAQRCHRSVLAGYVSSLDGESISIKHL